MKWRGRGEKAGGAVLTPDKTDFKTNTVIRDKKDPAIPLLSIYLKKLKILNPKDMYIHMFTAALFPRAKIRKQPKCPWVDEQIKKWCMYTVEYDSAINKE